MNIYLDDNRTDKALIGLLWKAGHSVMIPADVGLSGRSDACHLEAAVRNGLALLTADHSDFGELHNLVRTSAGNHPGILLVRFEKDSKRTMRPKHIVTAIRKLEQARIDSTNQIIVLNHWR